MKRMTLFVLMLCLGLAILGGAACAEDAAASLSPEELCQAGDEAYNADTILSLIQRIYGVLFRCGCVEAS